MVLTFRNVHDWIPRGTTQDYFKAFYRALKPGGILGITDHRADPSQPQDPKAGNGYVRQDYTIQIAEQAGFKLAGTSEINANPKDPRNQPVWTTADPASGRQGSRQIPGHRRERPHDAQVPQAELKKCRAVQATASSPFLATRARSFSEVPRGCFSPRSHWLMIPVVTFR